MRPHHAFANIGSRRAGTGSVSLEFVILLSFLIMVVVGVVDFTLMLFDKAVLTNAARDGARAGVVLRVPPLTASQVAAVTLADAQANLITNGSSTAPTVTVSQPSGTNSGNPLQVSVSYPYQGILIGSAISVLTGPVTLNATSVMDYE